MQYTKEQQPAVSHASGPALVLAGPGSGKTRVILGRVAHLVSACRISPHKILVLTFTRAAAAEMQSRGRRLQKDGEAVDFSAVTFGTFHAVFFSFLKTLRQLDAASLLSEKEALLFLREVLEKRKAPRAGEKAYLFGLLSRIAAQKANPQQEVPEDFAEIFRAYETLRQARGKLDFEDILSETRTLLTDAPQTAVLLAARYERILVDEAQDMNPVQYDILKLLAGESGELFLVGDDDQSIYGFRGSRPDLLFTFQKDFPQASYFYLSGNFRCAQEIARAAQTLIDHNRCRYPKETVSQTAHSGEIIYRRFHNAPEEAEAIRVRVQRLLEKETAPRQIAVLCRSFQELTYIRSVLEERGLPCVGKRKERSGSAYPFYIEDLLSYLRIASRCEQEEDPYRIANRPFRDLSRGQVNASRAWERVLEEIHFAGSLAPSAALTYILEVIGYRQFLRDFAQDSAYGKAGAYEAWAVSLRAFIQKSEAYETVASFLKALAEGEPAAKSWGKERQSVRQGETDGIVFSTYHGAKGLEFDTVFLPSLNENIVPHQAVSESRLEEERRTFYVAMTRAKRRLFLSRPLYYRGKETMPSRFLAEIRPAAEGERG